MAPVCWLLCPGFPALNAWYNDPQGLLLTATSNVVTTGVVANVVTVATVVTAGVVTTVAVEVSLVTTVVVTTVVTTGAVTTCAVFRESDVVVGGCTAQAGTVTAALSGTGTDCTIDGSTPT